MVTTDQVDDNVIKIDENSNFQRVETSDQAGILINFDNNDAMIIDEKISSETSCLFENSFVCLHFIKFISSFLPNLLRYFRVQTPTTPTSTNHQQAVIPLLPLPSVVTLPPRLILIPIPTTSPFLIF